MTTDGRNQRRAVTVVLKIGQGIVLLVIAYICIVAILVSWRVADVSITTPSELFAQSQQMFDGLGFVVAVIAAVATLVYTKLTKDAVVEMREARRQENARVAQAREDARLREATESAITLIDAAGRVIALVFTGNTLLKRRYMFGVPKQYPFSVWDRVMEAEFAAARALNVLHVVDPPLAARSAELWEVLDGIAEQIGGKQIAVDDARVRRAAELRAALLDHVRERRGEQAVS